MKNINSNKYQSASDEEVLAFESDDDDDDEDEEGTYENIDDDNVDYNEINK
jgi:hypothetical protein